MRSATSVAGALSVSNASAPTGSSMPSRPTTIGQADTTRPSADGSPAAWMRSWAASCTGWPGAVAAASSASTSSAG